jgi:hypothetical protein
MLSSMFSSRVQRRKRKTKEMASCNSSMEMQLLRNNANGNTDDGKNIHGKMKRKRKGDVAS